MIQRVIFDCNAPSPLRISVVGVDAASAEFNNLIFDANQSPLRLAGTGYLSIDGMTQNQFSGGQNVRESHTGSPVTTPNGTTAIFMTQWRKDDGIGRVFTPSFQAGSNSSLGGGGGGICSNLFAGVCFNVAVGSDPNQLPAGNFANYCIFKNYN